MNKGDRDLLMPLGTISKRVSQIITNLFEDSLTCDEQLDFAHRLTPLAEGFHQRALRTPLVVEEDPA